MTGPKAIKRPQFVGLSLDDKDTYLYKVSSGADLINTIGNLGLQNMGLA